MPLRHPPAVFAVVLAVFLSLSLLPASPVRAQAFECSDCHEVELAPASVHLDFGCTGCHSEIEDYPHPEDMVRGQDVCAQCHGVQDELEASVHAGMADCATCHGAAHEILPVSDSGSPSAVRNQPITCGQCHDQELIDAFVESAHGSALLEAGLAVSPSCAGCHGAHDIQPTESGESRVSFEHVPETCGDCHQFILDDWLTGAHGTAWEEAMASGDGGAGGEAAAAAMDPHGAAPPGIPVCSTCHTSHDIVDPDSTEVRLVTVETCGDCHGGPFHTYRDSFHGKATSLGFERAATCSDCHTSHVNLAATDPRSSVHPDNLVATCGQCHDDMSAGFLTFDPHVDPSDPEQSHPAVYWIYFFMTGLLIAVFAFFGLHTVLWLQRALVGWSRGELKSEHGGEGPWVRRFNKFHRGTHLLIIISFLALAATGLPLKFHYTDWAQALGQVPFGFELAHLVHRIAAVITFGYAFAHIAFLFHRTIIKKEGGLLYGWRSMVPRPQDLTDLLRNIRWFLYMGPRPKFDRWTYWEKFDYFAVFWGVPIIGISGLMLWFPSLFTSFLPGWALNAAWVVHSDEALLATGFIFIFHFFHTHLRPEAFPMDPVMFVGAMPLERFKEERPQEYQRMVEKGELEEHFVDPPSARELRRARIFGFLAVAIGLACAIGILVGVFAY